MAQGQTDVVFANRGQAKAKTKTKTGGKFFSRGAEPRDVMWSNWSADLEEREKSSRWRHGGQDFDGLFFANTQASLRDTVSHSFPAIRGPWSWRKDGFHAGTDPSPHSSFENRKDASMDDARSGGLEGDDQRCRMGPLGLREENERWKSQGPGLGLKDATVIIGCREKSLKDMHAVRGYEVVRDF